MAAHSLFGFLVLLSCFLLLLLAADDKENHEESPNYSPCGYLGKIRFPFTKTTNPKCGLPIRGCDNHGAVKQVQLKNQSWYNIDSIHQKGGYNSVFIYYPDYGSFLSSTYASGTIMPPESPIMPFYIQNNITFYRCIRNSYAGKGPTNMFMYKTCPDYDIYYSYEHDDVIGNFPILPFACLLVKLPIGQQPNSIPPCRFLISFLEIGVRLPKSCEDCYDDGRSQCLLDKDFSCIHEAPFPPPAPDVDTKAKGLKVMKIIGLSFGLAGVITIALFVILLLYKRRYKSSGVQNQPRNTYPGPYRSTTNPESGTVYFGVPVFSYEELQEATNNFDQARELGEGGFGTVYYGNLGDGREVAVKRLYKRNYRPVESFINEIQILTRLRHRNLVSLYGCTSRHSRELLLVYEYIPNGTVSYHLHGDNKAKPGSLPWPMRMKIAIETASALTYLHASDIIHRDVKTSNILLDNSFCVKVADFGLSRLFPNDVTHVSTAPRGTPGYVDPDYRLCYQLTSKSDVYSFGVVLIELISSMPAVDITRDRDEVNLANLAIRKIQKRAFSELVDPSLGFHSDDKLKRMIVPVAELAFKCLQGDKELRPSMGDVLEVLQRIESGKDEPRNLEGIDVHGAGVGVSHSYAHPSLPNTLMKPHRLHKTL